MTNSFFKCTLVLRLTFGENDLNKMKYSTSYKRIISSPLSCLIRTRVGAGNGGIGLGLADFDDFCGILVGVFDGAFDGVLNGVFDLFFNVVFDGGVFSGFFVGVFDGVFDELRDLDRFGGTRCFDKQFVSVP